MSTQIMLFENIDLSIELKIMSKKMLSFSYVFFRFVDDRDETSQLLLHYQCNINYELYSSVTLLFLNA